MRRNLNLILAAIWLLVALGILYAAYVNPESPYLRIVGTSIPAVWLALALVGYNLLRWWLTRK